MTAAERRLLWLCVGWLAAVIVTGCRCPSCPKPLAEDAEVGVIPVTVEDAGWDDDDA